MNVTIALKPLSRHIPPSPLLLIRGVEILRRVRRLMVDLNRDSRPHIEIVQFPGSPTVLAHKVLKLLPSLSIACLASGLLGFFLLLAVFGFLVAAHALVRSLDVSFWCAVVVFWDPDAVHCCQAEAFA